jgi:hypothetical protein
MPLGPRSRPFPAISCGVRPGSRWPSASTLGANSRNSLGDAAIGAPKTNSGETPHCRATGSGDFDIPQGEKLGQYKDGRILSAMGIVAPGAGSAEPGASPARDDSGPVLWAQCIAPAGRRTVKTEPLPGSLATVTSPPIMRASLREMARPSPVPP